MLESKNTATGAHLEDLREKSHNNEAEGDILAVARPILYRLKLGLDKREEQLDDRHHFRAKTNP